MILEQFYLGCLSHASYIIADEQTREAIIVDPQRDIDTYAPYVAEHQLQLIGTVLTHFHADFIAGHIELHERYGVPIYLGAAAQADFEFEALADGERLAVGAIEIKVLATPGHTPEGISLLVHDESGKAHAVLTGDTLFIGDVGRPDLLASIGVTAHELATMLYHSLHEQLLTLPDDVLVYPAHGAGSLCGKHLSSETVSTIGAQRAENYALQDMSEEDFIRVVTAEQPESPQYFIHNATMNKQERSVIDKVMAKTHTKLSLDELRARVAAGDQIIDIRSENEVHAAYYRPAINIGLDGKYATWAGSLLQHDAPITVITHADDHEEAIMRLGRIGYDQVTGYVVWDEIKDDLSAAERVTTQRVQGAALETFLSTAQPQIIDVRSPQEFSTAHFPQAENIPLSHLAEAMQDKKSAQTYLVHCAGGYRSSAAVTLLQSMGFSAVYDLAGGFKPAYIGADACVGSSCQLRLS